MVKLRSPMTGLLAAAFADATGTGLYMAGSVVFFTRYVHLGAAQIGSGLAAAGLVSFLTLVPLGMLADRVGPRRMLIAAHLWRAAVLACYPLASSFPAFVLAVSALSVADRAATPLLQGLFGVEASKEARVRSMGIARSLQNAGMALGGLLAGAALWSDSTGGYLGIVYGDCLSFALAALLVARLPVTGATAAPARRTLPWRERLSVFTDRPFAVFTTLSSVVSLHVTVLVTGIPLWVLAHPDIPRTTVAWTMVLNTVVVVAFQVRAVRGVESALDGGRALRRSAFLLAACCGGVALSAVLSPWAAVVVLLAAVVLQSFAEMTQQAGAWAISYELAPEDRRNVYLAFFGLGSAARNFYGPLVITFCAVRLGGAGWLLLALLVALAGAWAARFGGSERASVPATAPSTAVAP